ncbi:retropepsin-like aspartic protease [Hymenobacter ruricola]|uniref:Clan AA aspartic protease n=1 Tax=Hymenobacter ruricola TaxID=2791023 RepID=A0ABS0I3N1_9BACT|nr:retropepsin-like aspartic protease [Hymenobacter ruricola]MBF9221406.1 clan AA aspartic protease [Hymenobacter ruricola]
MKHLIFCIIMIWPLLLAAQTKPNTTIPFVLEDNCVYIYCQVNTTDSLKFIFDTGANGSVLSETAANRLKLPRTGTTHNVGSNGTNTVSQSAGNVIRFGSLTKSNALLTLIPYEGFKFDGVFGTDLMKGYVIEVDYHKKELRFYEPAGYHNDLGAYARCKLRFVADYPTVTSTIVANGRRYTGRFGLDTGAEDVLTVAAPFGRKHGLPARLPRIGTAVSQGSDGSTYESAVALAPEIRFGRKCFYRVPATLSQSTSGADATEDKAGFWGNGFLKRFNAVWDFDRNYLYLKPNKNLYTEL